MRHRAIPEQRGVLTVVPNGLFAKVRKFVYLCNLGPVHSLGVYNNDISAVQTALTERYFLCDVGGGVFQPALDVRHSAYENDRGLSLFREMVVTKIGRAPVVPISQVVEAYTGPKRQIYVKAAASLSSDRVCKRDARLTMFVKFEKQDLKKAPRGINPRAARFNLVLGRRLKFLEKRVYRAINKTFCSATRHTVIKGLNVNDTADVIRRKWGRFRDPVAVGLDAKKFDMHVSVPALKYEHSIYLGVFWRDPELKRLLLWQLNNVGIAYCHDGKVKFRMKGTRASGDLNTSMGNCIIMCALIWAWQYHTKTTVELCNNGDDCVVILERAELAQFMCGLPKFFATKGFRMEIEPAVDVFEQIVFCQSSPVLTINGWCMVRDVRACFRKDPMCLVPIQNADVLKKWRHAVGNCGRSITCGVPVMHAWYTMFMRDSIECSDGMLRQINRNTSAAQRMEGLVAQDETITADARVSFYYAFGFTPDEQLLLEQRFSQTKFMEEVIDVQAEHAAFWKHESLCSGLMLKI